MLFGLSSPGWGAAIQHGIRRRDWRKAGWVALNRYTGMERDGRGGVRWAPFGPQNTDALKNLGSVIIQDLADSKLGIYRALGQKSLSITAWGSELLAGAQAWFDSGQPEEIPLNYSWYRNGYSPADGVFHLRAAKPYLTMKYATAVGRKLFPGLRARITKALPKGLSA